ncbi:hypothetical protein HaLaN_12032 [Haematococcus lacustris]|uniref:Uncharacterized protein n=1 Tax=Haematococcus lacustris TaxID=44745 RepID=A0A699ZJ58_HAELA|nr:hypothetical protein HaLaN_12032 [Haematococcus lacustris]
MEREAVESGISRRYRTQRGSQGQTSFDVSTCLKDFYSSPRSWVLKRAVGRSGAELDREQLMPLALEVWHDIQTRARDDAVDFLLL